MIDRRSFMAGFGALVAAPAFAVPAFAAPVSTASLADTAWQFTFEGIDGKPIRLADDRGKAILVVNTACLCGYTPQFAGLQKLWTQFHDNGLVIIGVPSNDFGGQDPGTNDEIASFAAKEYGVTFPMAAKQVVVGAKAHPFYRWAAAQRPNELPRWNFHKYLIGRDGRIARVFDTGIPPTDPRVILAVEAVLKASA
jgi:glutathione peroxidase